jgi:predicted dehydrogenase
MTGRLSINKETPTVAVIGCGAWGKNLIRNFAELKALKAVCDADLTKARALSSEYGVPPLTEEEILQDTSIEAVVIASLAPLHANQAERALNAGKHVYIEKPMALSISDAQKLCDLAKAQDRILMVGHILNYHPAFLALKEKIPELGPLKHIYANRLGLGRFRRKENVLWDLASHDISLILSLTQSMPTEVKATAQGFLAPMKPASAMLHLAFEDNLTAHLHASWLSPFKEQKLVVIGKQGIAVFDDRKPWEEKLVLSMGCLEWKDDEPHANDKFNQIAIQLTECEPLKEECSHFLHCIQEGNEPLTSGLEGLRVTQVLEAADKSLYER